jgi:two-component system chemotaxis response regulator CheB
MLDDGTAGLWAIKDRGGIALVQSPDEAPYPSMPRSALRHVAVDETVRVDELGALLRKLTAETIRAPESPMTTDKLSIETRIAIQDDALKMGVRSLGALLSPCAPTAGARWSSCGNS